MDRKIAVLGDIHANLDALEVVLADARAQNVNEFICTGDVVGYNACPNECCKLVRELGCAVVQGNHDHYCAFEESLEDFHHLAAAKITDTVKSVNRAGAIEKTLDRDPLWAAQTPQVFRADLLRKALEKADDKDASITDESSAVERLGQSVRIVESKEPNPKITYPGDVGTVARLLGIA